MGSFDRTRACLKNAKKFIDGTMSVDFKYIQDIFLKYIELDNNLLDIMITKILMELWYI